jgi:predicted transcriptional regulator
MEILISIKPEWVKKILSGEKTIEVRKSKPKFAPPITCYIYESGTGKVVAQFICDTIDVYEPVAGSPFSELEEKCWNGERWKNIDYDKMCLSEKEFNDYKRGSWSVYGWHISNIKIYEIPKSLEDFGVKRAPQSWQYVSM